VKKNIAALRKSNSVDRNNFNPSVSTEVLIQKPIDSGMLFGTAMKLKGTAASNSFLAKTEESHRKIPSGREYGTNSLIIGPATSFLIPTQKHDAEVETPERKIVRNTLGYKRPDSHLTLGTHSHKSSEIKARPSMRDSRKYVIKVDIESSKHKNLKKTQYINRVKEIYNNEIQYVDSVIMIDFNGISTTP
jgi:hypothetical protein